MQLQSDYIEIRNTVNPQQTYPCNNVVGERLTLSDPANTRWQRDLSQSTARKQGWNLLKTLMATPEELIGKLSAA